MAAFTRTPAQVLASTGVAGITDADIATARGILSAAVGVDLSVDPAPVFRARDLSRLTSALDWQAVYVHSNPGLATKAGNLAAASANGVGVTYAGTSAGALLAPLAKMSLDRLSWRRSRSVKMRRVKDAPLPAPQTLTNDGADGDWTPLR